MRYALPLLLLLTVTARADDKAAGIAAYVQAYCHPGADPAAGLALDAALSRQAIAGGYGQEARDAAKNCIAAARKTAPMSSQQFLRQLKPQLKEMGK